MVTKMTRTILKDVWYNLPSFLILAILWFMFGSYFFPKEDYKNNSMEMFNTLSNSGSVILKVNDSKQVSEVFGDTQAVFGLSAKEMVGLPISQLIPPEHRERHDEYIDHVFQNKQPIIISIVNEIENRETKRIGKYNIKCYYSDAHAWCVIDPFTYTLGS